MKIRMLDTVEDSQPYIDDSGDKPQVKYSVLKLKKDGEYEDQGPDWDKRCAKLIKLGFAEEVEA